MSPNTTIESDLYEELFGTGSGDPGSNGVNSYPNQGNWTEQSYLALDTNRLIELSDGCLEILPMPTRYHQRLAQLLFKLLEAWVLARNLGEVFIAPLRIRLWSNKVRMPDIVFFRPMPDELDDPHALPTGADLAMEVVSPGEANRKRDLVTKRAEYAKAGIAEYWIVDPQELRITVLTLDGSTYKPHGEFEQGSHATSVMLPGFTVDVSAVFEAGNKRPTAPQP